MPNETKIALGWSFDQFLTDEFESKHYVKDVDGEINTHLLVDFTRKYFNDNNIEYGTFSYDDLKPLLT